MATQVTNTDTYKELHIVLRDGEEKVYRGEEWDDYTVALAAPEPVAVVKLRGAWIGLFPLANVKYIQMS